MPLTYAIPTVGTVWCYVSAPSLSGITRLDSSPTNNQTVRYTVAFDEDMTNLPHMQQGMKVAAINGRDGLILGDYQEARIKHLHNSIDKYIEAGEKA